MSSPIRCTPFEPSTNSTYKYCDRLIKVTTDTVPKPLLTQTNRHHQPATATVLPAKFERVADAIANFHVRADDIWLVTFPKCGTTWTQEMVRLLNSDLNYESVAQRPVDKDFAFLEKSIMFDPPVSASDGSPFFRNSVDLAHDRPSPRLIKTHLPMELLPAQLWTVRPRIVYTARNPKDTAVSFFHHYRNIQRYGGTFGEFMAAFLADEVIYAPFAPHVCNFWTMRHEENVLFLKFEEMKTDMLNVLRKTQTFLGKSFSDEQLRRLENHLHVDNMRHNGSANNSTLMADLTKIFDDDLPDKEFRFVRKGIVGAFKEEMTQELIDRFDEKTNRDFAGVDFRFDDQV